MSNLLSRRGLMVLGLLLAAALAVVLFVPGVRDFFLGRTTDDGAGARGATHQGKNLNEWIRQLESSSAEEQAAACLAFQYFPQKQAAAAVPNLLPLLKSDRQSVRGAAAYALGRLGPPAREAIPVLAQMLDDEDRSAAEALDLLCGPEDKAVVPALKEALEKAPVDASWEYRLPLARALGKIGPEARSAVPALTELLKEMEKYLRAAASESLGQIGPEAASALPALNKLLDDPEGMVRAEAALALWRIEKSPNAVPTLLAQFNQRKNPWERKEAARALGRMGPGAAAAVPDLLEAALHDTTPGVNGRYEVRMAAADALERIDPKAAAKGKAK